MASRDMVKRVLDPRRGRVVREVRTALANRDVVPLRRQVAAWRRGFYADTSRLYDFDTYGFDAYISDYTRATTLAAMNENRHVLDDKVVTYLYLRAFGVPTPAVHGLVHDGEVVWLGEAPPAGGLDGLLERRGELAVKSRSGSGGSGFAVLRREGGTTTVNGRPVEDAVRALGTGSLVISDFVQQHERIAAVYPGTTNTMRVITFRDPDTGRPFVAFASHRFGTERSAPVDNYGAGGLSAGIDLETGRLTSAIWKRPTGDGEEERVWVDEHPGTGTRITGLEVPHWQAVLDGVLRAAEALPGCRYVGWDLAVTADGFSVIEGNNRSDVVLQIHKPLLLDERVRRVFAAGRAG